MSETNSDMSLTLDDCICPICKEILIEPVTLPCKHDLCLQCFRSNLEMTSMSCPMCRMRIASWSRRATRLNQLVNESKWLEIQRLFPQKVRRRSRRESAPAAAAAAAAPVEATADAPDASPLNSSLTETDDESQTLSRCPKTIAEPGEIRREYEEQIKLLQEEQKRISLEEQRASEELIRQLAIEERTSVDFWKKQQELIEKDSIFARALHNDTTVDENDLTEMLNSPRTTRSGFQSKTPTLLEKINSKNKRKKSSTVVRRSCSANDKLDGGSGDNQFNILPAATAAAPPAVTFDDTTHEAEPSVADERCNSSESSDSISHEINHFRPIQICPRTPPKRLASGRLHEPPIVRSTPVNISRPDSLTSPLCDSIGGSPVMQRRLLDLAVERQNSVDKLSKSTSTDAAPILSSPDSAGRRRGYCYSRFPFRPGGNHPAACDEPVVPLTFKRAVDSSDEGATVSERQPSKASKTENEKIFAESWLNDSQNKCFIREDYQLQDNPSKDYQSQDYPSKDYQSRDNPSKDYQLRDYPSKDYQLRNYPSKDYQLGDYPSKDYQLRNYPSKDYQSQDYPSKDYQSRDNPSKDYRSQDYPSKDNQSRDNPSKDYRSQDYPSKDYQSRDYPSKDYQSRDYPSKSQGKPSREEYPSQSSDKTNDVCHLKNVRLRPTSNTRLAKTVAQQRTKSARPKTTASPREVASLRKPCPRRKRSVVTATADKSSDESVDNSSSLAEVQDRLIAEQLQKQYDVEARLKTTFTRFVGTDENYNFRSRKRGSRKQQVEKQTQIPS